MSGNLLERRVAHEADIYFIHSTLVPEFLFNPNALLDGPFRFLGESESVVSLQKILRPCVYKRNRRSVKSKRKSGGYVFVPRIGCFRASTDWESGSSFERFRNEWEYYPEPTSPAAREVAKLVRRFYPLELTHSVKACAVTQSVPRSMQEKLDLRFQFALNSVRIYPQGVLSLVSRLRVLSLKESLRISDLVFFARTGLRRLKFNWRARAIKTRTEPVLDFFESFATAVLSNFVKDTGSRKSVLHSLVRLHLSPQERETNSFRFEDAIKLAFMTINEREATRLFEKGNYSVTLFPVDLKSKWDGASLKGPVLTVRGDELRFSMSRFAGADGAGLAWREDFPSFRRGDWLVETRLGSVFFFEKGHNPYRLEELERLKHEYTPRKLRKPSNVCHSRFSRIHLTNAALQHIANEQALGLLSREAAKNLEWTTWAILQRQLSLKSKVKSIKEASPIPFDVLVNCWYLSQMCPNAPDLEEALKKVLSHLENWQPTAFKILDKSLGTISLGLAGT